MPFFDDVVKKYAVTGNTAIDWNEVPLLLRNPQPGDAVPQLKTEAEMQGHGVEYTISGEEYFKRLLVEIDKLIANPKDAYFWVHGWYFSMFDEISWVTFHTDRSLPEAMRVAEPETGTWKLYAGRRNVTFPGSKKSVLDKLVEMEKAGVDVRVIGWMNPIWSQCWAIAKATKSIGEVRVWINSPEMTTATGYYERNFTTLLSLVNLRGKLKDKERVIFNGLSHPLGGAHMKMVVCGTKDYRLAFTSGVDLCSGREDIAWLDPALIVEGNAAKQAGKFFIDLWNEISKTDSVNIHFGANEYFDETKVVIKLDDHPMHYGKTLPTDVPDVPFRDPNAVHDKYLQMYRTLPRKNYVSDLDDARHKYLARYIWAYFFKAPSTGENFVRAMIKLPSLYTPPLTMAPNGLFEFKSMCFKAISVAEKYIFLWDQSGTNLELMSWINHRVKEKRRKVEYLRVIIVAPYLIGELGSFAHRHDLKSNHEQTKVLERLTAGIPKNQWDLHFTWLHAGHHAKVLMVDDKWVAVGSGNCMRRSFYTDIEMGYSVMHDTWVRDLRNAIWKRFIQDDKEPIPSDTEQALGLWFDQCQDPKSGVDYTKLVLKANLQNLVGRPLKGNKAGKPWFEDLKFDMTDPDSNNKC